jgi:hypothetical protein
MKYLAYKGEIIMSNDVKHNDTGNDIIEYHDKILNKINKRKKVPKTINIHTQEAVLEGSLIEVPFISINSQNKIKVMNYNWTDANGIERGVEVVGGGKYRVPSTLEYDTLVALFRLFAKQNKIEFGDDFEIENEELIINFSLNDLAKEMGYKSISGKILNRIKQSIETLVQITISNRKAGALYDIQDGQYIADTTTLFHIIEEATFYDILKNPISNRKDLNCIRLGKFFYQSIKHGYFKYFNYAIYLNLTSGIAKRIFLCLTKWRNNKTYITLKYNTLYSKIPLEESIPNYQKKASLKRACEILKKVNFITEYDMQKDVVTFVFYNKNRKLV